MSEQCKPFIWLGTDGHGRGDLWLDKTEIRDGRLIIIDKKSIKPKGVLRNENRPQDGEYDGIVKSPDNLARLTPERLAEFVKDGCAKYLTIIEGAEAAFAKAKDSEAAPDDAGASAAAASVKTSAAIGDLTASTAKATAAGAPK
jgi:hypothetical protein